MNKEESWQYLNSLDDKLLHGGVILSEWCTLIVRETDIAFVNSANLAVILTAVSAIETNLRSEYANNNSANLFALINDSPIREDLKLELHKLRKYRNRWVHVNAPWDDDIQIDPSSEILMELEEMAMFAAYLLRRTIYENQWV